MLNQAWAWNPAPGRYCFFFPHALHCTSKSPSCATGHSPCSCLWLLVTTYMCTCACMQGGDLWPTHALPTPYAQVRAKINERLREMEQHEPRG